MDGPSDGDDEDQESFLKDLYGYEPYLVGLSQTFWAHVPMSIAMIDNLELIRGVNCMIVNKASVENESLIVPVHKCLLTGMVVSTEQIRNARVYVLDDGTGLIDCTQFIMDEDPFGLPNLFDQPHDHGQVQVGDFVKVCGRIQCVEVTQIGPTRRALDKSTTIDHIACSREVVVSDMNLLEDANDESCHWMAVESHWNKIRDGAILANGVDWLHRLGPEIADEVREGRHLPCAVDTLGAYKIFGPSCRCDLPYKMELLYCHCIATVEARDPSFAFRDYLLYKLCKIQKHQGSKPLRFKASMFTKDDRTMDRARKALDTAEPPTDPMVQWLLRKIFRILHSDGILYLENDQEDIYQLITVTQVLMPYVADLCRRGASLSLETRPRRLRGVNKEKLYYVKRMLSDDQSRSQEDVSS